MWQSSPVKSILPKIVNIFNNFKETFEEEQAQICAEGCEGGHLYSLLTVIQLVAVS
jgi:hypothetical protein